MTGFPRPTLLLDISVGLMVRSRTVDLRKTTDLEVVEEVNEVNEDGKVIQ